MKNNTQKIVIAAIIIMTFFGSVILYFSLIRPTQIKKECAVKAYDAKTYVDKYGMKDGKYQIIGQQKASMDVLNEKYEKCILMNGL